MNLYETIQWRWATSEDWRTLGELYALGFGLDQETRFFEDFPTWDPRFEIPLRHQILGFMGSELVATASVLVRDLLRPSRRVGIVGGVVVRDSARGQGLAKMGIDQILTFSEASLHLKDWVLWTGNPRLYESFGFVPTGIQFRANGIPKWLVLENAQSVLTAEGMWPKEWRVIRGFSEPLWNELKSRQTGFTLNESHRSLVERFVNVDWWSLEDNGGKMRAFLGIGRGIDLPNMIHEWGGAEFELKMLVKEVLNAYPDPEWIFSPRMKTVSPYLNHLSILGEDPLCYWRTLAEPLSPLEVSELWFWGTDSS
jgi:predicted GNAT family N-acyltransferase